ncbi:MAG: branched-chain amino acid ABC transporter permease [Bacteroidales bacterium]|nr:branched-chain amino acid ABC transporter permease [Bacteroidales bacterium]
MPDQMNALTDLVLQVLLNGLVSGSAIALVALGFSLVYHTTRIFHIAYAALYALGGYTFWFVHFQLGADIPVSLLAAVLLSSTASLLLWLLVYKPLVKMGSASNELMVASIGMMMVLIYLLSLIFGTEPKLSSTGNDGLISARMLQLVLTLIVLSAILLITNKTNVGLKMRAFRDNPPLLKRFGVNSIRLTTSLFLLSGLLVGLGAALSTNDLGISPFTGVHVFINAFIAVVAGGSGRVSGAVIGGFLLGFLQSVVVYVAGSEWILSVSFVILILIMLIKPEGITGMAYRRA